jgi:hypothetical protein
LSIPRDKILPVLVEFLAFILMSCIRCGYICSALYRVVYKVFV